MSPSEIQELISYIGHRFDAVDRRFDAMETRFAEFRHEMLGHLDAIYRRLERLEQEYYAITQSLRRIEEILAEERNRRLMLEQELAALRQRVTGLEGRVDQIQRRLPQ